MTAYHKIIHAPNLLGLFLSKPGGISRYKAVDRAKRGVEELRVDSEAAIWKEIARFEEVLISDKRVHAEFLMEREMEDIQSRAASILNLAGTFGHDRLVDCLKSLCDVITAMIERGLCTAEPIAVHIRALALFEPSDGTVLSDAEAEDVLSGLRKIVTHIRYETPENA